MPLRLLFITGPGAVGRTLTPGRRSIVDDGDTQAVEKFTAAAGFTRKTFESTSMLIARYGFTVDRGR